MSAVHLLASPSLSLSAGVGVTLQPGQAHTLRVPGAGVLRVSQGALWVTRHATHAHPWPDDVYLTAGEPLALQAGESVVIEPIRPHLAAPAPVAPATFSWQASSGRCAGVLRWLRERLGAPRQDCRACA